MCVFNSFCKKKETMRKKEEIYSMKAWATQAILVSRINLLLVLGSSGDLFIKLKRKKKDKTALALSFKAAVWDISAIIQ